MMKSLLVLLVVSFSSVMGAASSCTTSSNNYNSRYTCNQQYVCDYYSCYWQDYCYYYGGDGSAVETAKDMVSESADNEAAQLKLSSKFYAEKFQLSDQQGMKLAKVVHDYSTLESRTDSDMAQFAEKLYGLNAKDIASAVGKAQIGDSSQLNTLIDQAAANFNTSSKNMKSIVKYMHGKALNESGIVLE